MCWVASRLPPGVLSSTTTAGAPDDAACAMPSCEVVGHHVVDHAGGRQHDDVAVGGPHDARGDGREQADQREGPAEPADDGA